MDFHVVLARAARNEVLEATVEAYRQLLVPSIRDLRDDKSGRATQKAHEELVEAVRRHDPEGARDIMLSHLADFEKRLRRSLATRSEAAAAPELAAPRLVRVRGK
jgi:GntR family transcriptional repressor for pyruvate dehydrogenase complex